MRKCRAKGLEFVVANDISEEGSGFSSDTNRVSIVYKNGDVKDLSMMKKRNLAAIIVDEISSLCL
jgi:phosphopantothenoylcysteine decarboxylase/phosphopantothenate--cysteine ligase